MLAFFSLCVYKWERIPIRRIRREHSRIFMGWCAAIDPLRSLRAPPPPAQIVKKVFQIIADPATTCVSCLWRTIYSATHIMCRLELLYLKFCT